MLWNITTVTQEMEKRTLLWGSSSTRKWRNPRLLWKEFADLTLFEYRVSASGKHQSLFVLQSSVHLSATARPFLTGNEMKTGSGEKEIDIQIHCCDFVSSLSHIHVLPLVDTYFCVIFLQSPHSLAPDLTTTLARRFSLYNLIPHVLCNSEGTTPHHFVCNRTPKI